MSTSRRKGRRSGTARHPWVKMGKSCCLESATELRMISEFEAAPVEREAVRRLVEEPPRSPTEVSCQTGLRASGRGGGSSAGEGVWKTSMPEERRKRLVESYLRDGACPIGVPVRTLRKWEAEYRKSSLPADLVGPQDKEPKAQ
jgi:hypothetical protein